MHPWYLSQEFDRCLLTPGLVSFIFPVPECRILHIECHSNIIRLVVLDDLIQHINKGKHALGVDAFRCHHGAHRKIRPEKETVSVYQN